MAEISRKGQPIINYDRREVMAKRIKVFSSLRENKYIILKNISKKYEVSESEIIRNIVERVLGNNKLEKNLIYDIYSSNYKNIDDNDNDNDNDNDDTNRFVLVETETGTDIVDYDDDKMPKVCPQCGQETDFAGNKVISYNRITNTWTCSNCFASGGNQ
jgi:hypothetical protein